MAVHTDSQGKIVKSGQGKKSLAQLINDPSMLAEIRRALPRHISPEKMARIVLTALRTTRDLEKCTPESFLGCVMQASQLGLELNTPTGQAYLIPRRNNKQGTTECTLIVGYQGMIELALRSGKVEKVWTRVVHEGDHFRVRLGLEEDIEHEPSAEPDREKRPITYIYAVAALTTGGKVFEVLSAAQIEARRGRSDSGGRSYSPWQTDFEAMARKTGVRALFKWLPKSSELAAVEALDERLEQGRSQTFDPAVNESLEHLGLRPIDTEGESESAPESRVEVDPETGEVNGGADARPQ